MKSKHFSESGTGAEDFPLHQAANRGDNDLVKRLLEQGADIEARNRSGYTPLHESLVALKPKAVCLLLESGANANADAPAYAPVAGAPLHIIAQTLPLAFDEPPKIRQIVLALCKNLKEKDEQREIDALSPTEGVTPLWIAAKYNNSAALQALIEQGANINFKNPKGHTALHSAAHGGCLDSVKILLNANAKMNEVTPSSATPFYLAIHAGHYQIMKLLIERDPSIVRYKSEEGITALHIAVEAKQPSLDIVKKLIECGIEIDAQSSLGRTPLQEAIPKKELDPEIINLLLDKSDINKLTPLGTALHVAVQYGTPDKVRALLDKGAKFNIKNKEEKTPLDLVRFSPQHSEMKRIFKQHQQKLLEEIKQHLIVSDCKVAASLQENGYEITIEHTDSWKALSVYLILKREKPQLRVRLEREKLILSEIRTSDLKDIASLLNFKDENNIGEKMVDCHNTLWGILEIDPDHVTMNGELVTHTAKRKKGGGQSKPTHTIAISYSFSDASSQNKFEAFLKRQQLGYSVEGNHLRVSYPRPIQLDRPDSVQLWIKNFEQLLSQAEEIKKNQKVKVVSKGELSRKEELRKAEETLKREKEVYQEALRKKEEIEREQEIERRKAGLQLKKIAGAVEPVSTARVGKKNIRRYNESKKEKTTLEIEGEKSKDTLSLDSDAPSRSLMVEEPHILPKPSPSLVKLERSEPSFFPGAGIKKGKKSKPILEKSVQNKVPDIEDFIKLVNKYDGWNRDPFIIRAIYYRVIHALIFMIEGKSGEELEPSSLEKLKHLRNVIVHDFCIHIDDGEVQNKLLEIARILCDKSKGENGKRKIQALKNVAFKTERSSEMLEEKDYLKLMNAELECLKRAFKPLEGKTNFYNSKYADSAYSCWISVCIIVECYHKLIEQRPQSTKGNTAIFNGKVRNERHEMKNVDVLLYECSSNIRNPMMHRKEKPIASAETMTTVFDRDKAYELVLWLNNCENFSLKAPQNSASFFPAASSGSASGPSGEPPKKERWMELSE